jgi:hypothetical protein
MLSIWLKSFVYPNILNAREQRKKTHDELCEDTRSASLERIIVFYAKPVTAILQLRHWAEGLHEAMTTFEAIKPSVLIYAKAE